MLPVHGCCCHAAAAGADPLRQLSVRPSPYGPLLLPWLQGYNKRATVLFLMGRYRDAVEDCIMVGVEAAARLVPQA